MSNSFYGGRDGQPFVIKETFNTVTAMTNEFKKGPRYTKVNFGEYALIETEHKNNPENGRIFRRGYDYNNTNNRYISSWTLDNNTNIFKENTETEPGGAIYVGQIIGPSGNAPHLHLLSTMQDVKNKYTEKENQIIQAGEDGSVIHLGGNNAFGPNFDIKQGFGEASLSTAPNGLGNLVPGKDGEKFNDNIKWHYCSIRDENQQETDAYIGFEIPYTVIEWDANSVSPYYNRNKKNTVGFDNLGLVDDARAEEEKGHPFYQKWKINIPKGIHGQSIESIGIATTKEEIDKIYTFDFTDKNAEDSRDSNTGLLKIKDYPGKDEDKSGDRQIIYCTVVDYDRVAAGDKYKIYLGDYNMIKEISLANDGTITIKYTHDNNKVWKKKLTWITDVDLSDTGKLNIKTNNHNKGTEIIDKQLQWVKNITFDEQGTIKLYYIDGTDSGDTYKNLVDWIKSVNIAQDGTVTIVSNNGTDFLINQDKLKWVNGVSLAQDGTFTTSYNNGDTATIQDAKLRWATNIQVADNGQVSTSYNDGTSVLGPKLDWIKSAILDEENNLKIDYVNAKDINVQLKTLNRVELDGNTLYGYYNTAPETRVSLGDTELGLSACVATEEEGPPSELRVGGLWFVADKKFGASS